MAAKITKPAFENVAIDFWIHPGRLGVRQPSPCLFHDAALKGTQLLDALTELNGDPRHAQRTLTFTACSRRGALRRLKLMLVPEREDLKIMNIRRHAANATIEMTEVGLSLVTAAVSAWLAGSEDFGISPQHSDLKPKQFGRFDRESGELWFWGPGYTGP